MLLVYGEELLPHALHVMEDPFLSSVHSLHSVIFAASFLYPQPKCCNATVIKDLPNMGTNVH